HFPIKALSTTILHLIGVRGTIDDKTLVAGAATDSFIRMIIQSDEKISKAGSQGLSDLLAENVSIRNSLLSSEFTQIVIRTLSQVTKPVAIHVKNGFLDVLLRLVTTADHLQALSVLVPVLEDMKTTGEEQLKTKSRRILTLLAGEGITSSSSSSSSSSSLTKVNSETYSQDHQYKERLQNELRIERQEKQIIGQENMKLKSDIEKMKGRVPLDANCPIAFHNFNAQIFDLGNIEGGKFQIVKKQGNWDAIYLEQDISNGVFAVEVSFQDTGTGFGAVGVVKGAYIIPNGIDLFDKNFAVYYIKYGGWKGEVRCKGKSTKGNLPYLYNQIVRAEFNSKTGTLNFSVDGFQQPVFIKGIEEKVRFVIFLAAKSSCIIHSVKKLEAPTSVHIQDEKAAEW
ncbi:MAG: hypothetical protein EZS28_007431, partial [Streblomastix strix]